MKLLTIGLLALVLAGTASAATPRERALQRQVKTLKQSNTRLAATVKSVRTERDSLKAERDMWITEVSRLKALILNEVHNLASSWRNDNNPKTEVSYYQADNWWSYSFTWCGFCFRQG